MVTICYFTLSLNTVFILIALSIASSIKAYAQCVRLPAYTLPFSIIEADIQCVLSAMMPSVKIHLLIGCKVIGRDCCKYSVKSITHTVMGIVESKLLASYKVKYSYQSEH